LLTDLIVFCATVGTNLTRSS